jgi:hypothetical protein
MSNQISGRQGRRLGHHLGHGFGRPVEGVRVLIPFTNALCKLLAQVIFGGKINHTQPLALSDTAPLFHLMHPRTVHWREVHHKTRMIGEPSGDFCTMMCTNVVTHEMNGLDVLGDLPIHMFQQGHEFLQPLACITLPIDLTGTSIAGGKEVESASACVCMFVPIGPGVGLSGQSWGRARPRWQRGRLVHGAYHLIGSQGARGEVDQLSHDGRAGGLSWRLGVEPRMMPPGCQLMSRQKASHGGSGNVRHDPLRDELGRQFGAIPWGAAPPQPIGTRAGQPHHVDRDLRGENPR